jgi:hypothetical protein
MIHNISIYHNKFQDTKDFIVKYLTRYDITFNIHSEIYSSVAQSVERMTVNH